MIQAVLFDSLRRVHTPVSNPEKADFRIDGLKEIPGLIRKINQTENSQEVLHA
jgi:hypothetical protein